MSEPDNPYRRPPDEHDVFRAFEEGERQGRGYGAAAERARAVAVLRGRAAGLRLLRSVEAHERATLLESMATLIEAGTETDVA